MTTQQSNQQRILYHLGDRCELIADIAEALELTPIQVGKATGELIVRGYLERVERGCFQLTVEGTQAVSEGIEIRAGNRGPVDTVRSPLRNTMRQRAWKAMQIHREFTVPEIAMVVARNDPASVYNSLQGFLRQLVSAGYLMRSPRKVPGTSITSNGFNRFRLVRDTGPRVPVFSKKRGAFHDFNTGEDVPCTTR